MEHFLGGQRSDRTRPFWGGDHKRKRKQSISLLAKVHDFSAMIWDCLLFCLFLFECMDGMEDPVSQSLRYTRAGFWEGDLEGIWRANVRFCTLDMVAVLFWGGR